MVALMDSEDERVALMAADKVFERAWGKPREYNGQESEPTNYLKAQATLEADKLTPAELDALEAFAKARISAGGARRGRCRQRRFDLGAAE
jgi:hypothetical protein